MDLENEKKFIKDFLNMLGGYKAQWEDGQLSVKEFLESLEGAAIDTAVLNDSKETILYLLVWGYIEDLKKHDKEIVKTSLETFEKALNRACQSY